MLWRLQHGELGELGPKTIVLNIGTNNLVGDATARTPPLLRRRSAFPKSSMSLCDAVPKSIVVMAVFPRGVQKGNPLDRCISELNAFFAKMLTGRPGLSLPRHRSHAARAQRLDL